MMLLVPLSSFLELVREWNVTSVAVDLRDGRTIVTAAHPTLDRILLSDSTDPNEEVRSRLRAQKLEVHTGSWAAGSETTSTGEAPEPWPYVAAVSYESSEEVPGVWVDAYRELPTQVVVLKRLYEELRSTGELDDIAFEEFVRLAKPNVVIVPPTDLREYIREQDPAPCDPIIA